MEERPTPTPPDELAFYQAWLGKLWPRYARRFEPGWDGKAFEWRAALYPLWLTVPGLYRPLAVLAAVVVAASTAELARTGGLQFDVALYVAGMVLVLWPIAFAFLAYTALTGQSTGALTFWPLGLLAAGVALGLLAPRWIVAEARRRWAGHAARVAAGETPKPPRSLTAPSTLRTLVLAVAIGVPVYFAVFRGHEHDHERTYAAAMRSDLRTLVSSQEAFFADSLRYTADLSRLDYEVTVGSTIEIIAASDSGWAAVARSDATTQVCGIFVGRVPPPVDGAVEGEPLCEARE